MSAARNGGILYIDWQFLILIVGGAASLGAAINHVREIFTAAKKPLDKVNARIDGTNARLDAFIDHAADEHDEYNRRFERDMGRIESLEAESRLNLKGTLTLISSAIDGNHIDELNERREEIQNYLINKS